MDGNPNDLNNVLDKEMRDAYMFQQDLFKAFDNVMHIAIHGVCRTERTGVMTVKIGQNIYRWKPNKKAWSVFGARTMSTDMTLALLTPSMHEGLATDSQHRTYVESWFKSRQFRDPAIQSRADEDMESVLKPILAGFHVPKHNPIRKDYPIVCFPKPEEKK